ncbi:glycogen branching enzyme [Magnetococcus marinus MC-1]|uniref:1,4-alpha-glucan branching enzyme GlgB n=1 Tax=Magnetococcus marinus (strain ATCC BAA-1437 / JCM 17883 / MC-1) TaxID=156889 RepID=A0L7G0_MAGMM|nr:1,4-alpha-glucan branching protein GlgB [Magnetococcus marinus]ABK43903.1 glycogen branching enzyme [Magnetococcus marinus MC-1]
MNLDPQQIQELQSGFSADPFAVLGRHDQPDGQVAVTVLSPRTERLFLTNIGQEMTRIPDSDLFHWCGDGRALPYHYRLRRVDAHGSQTEFHDPYSMPPMIGDLDRHLFNEGTHHHAGQFLGAHRMEVEGIRGVCFAVWAPNAQRVSVVGDFNQWDGRIHPMRLHQDSGIWEIFIPALKRGEHYKYEIRTTNGALLLKSDPYGHAHQLRPENASIITEPSNYPWHDEVWMRARSRFNWQKKPISIYEVHLGSWLDAATDPFPNYRELGKRLARYCSEMGFTHVELMPINEHPFDGSWGYQSTGYFAVTSRFGDGDDFRAMVDQLHGANIGVILDWVPAHFPKDAHGLGQFDGTALYEHQDPRLGEHQDWDTLIFNFGRLEVKSFLISSALHMLTRYHLDGLRVDAVASMLYLDYSREDWLPNKYGGRENLEAITFLRELNQAVHHDCPGVLMIAEESTAWPQVTRPPELGGLGFNMKWNMGWMNDTLSYFSKDPIHRKYHHDNLTFSLYYAFSENFTLPFSHDEVVHGKASMLGKMPGDEWQRFANLRLLYTYMFTHPGKKLLFMGCEFGQSQEWNFSQALPWELLEHTFHKGLQQLVKDLNLLYCKETALHERDFTPDGFQWIDCHDSDQSIISFQRKSSEGEVVVLLNFTPIPRDNYRIGVPRPGLYKEIFNADSGHYGGSNYGNGMSQLLTEPYPWMNQLQSLVLNVPPMAGIILRCEQEG